MRATHLHHSTRGGEPNQREGTRIHTRVEHYPPEIPFDLDEEMENGAALALARRHRSLVFAESKHPRF